MRLLQVMFSLLWGFGYLGNGILFLYIEWSFLRRSFVQIFNPLLQLQVLGVLLTTPLFWVFLVMAIVGHYAATIIEGSLAQGAKRTEINAAKVESPLPQAFQERQPSPASPSVLIEQTYSPVPPQPFPKPVSEPETESVDPQVKLLEWAIQSNQKVQFSYETQNGEKSDRTVTPIDFNAIEQTLCLEGYCHLKRAKRTFAIERMRDIRIVSAEANYERTTSQEVIAPYIDVQPEVSSAQQSLFSDATKTENTETLAEQRPCIKSHADELEKATDLEWNNANDATKTENVDTLAKQRPYIKFRLVELEKATDLEWNNVKKLSAIHYELEFRSRQKAVELRERIATRLTQLQGKQFAWSTTTANPGLQNLPNDAFKYEEGLLRRYGYKVGMNGLSESERWKILDTVFLRPLLQMNNPAYLSEWGEPNSAKRLQKLAESIAAFTRNAKRRNSGSFSQAIQDWETDLAYLKRTYYNNRSSFQYPRT